MGARRSGETQCGFGEWKTGPPDGVGVGIGTHVGVGRPGGGGGNPNGSQVGGGGV